MEHLDNILKLKSQRIDEMSVRLTKIKNRPVQNNIDIEECLSNQFENHVEM